MKTFQQNAILKKTTSSKELKNRLKLFDVQFEKSNLSIFEERNFDRMNVGIILLLLLSIGWLAHSNEFDPEQPIESANSSFNSEERYESKFAKSFAGI